MTRHRLFRRNRRVPNRRLLLSRGAPCCGGLLISAAQEGYVEIVKILLERANKRPEWRSKRVFYTLVGSMHAGKHTDKEAVLRTLGKPAQYETAEL
jgi:hypothetical protein